MRVRFRTSDNPNNDVVEAAIDSFEVNKIVCETAGGAGRVPDGAAAPGTPLRLAKLPNGDLTATWGASCNANDDDYALYTGTLGNFASHVPQTCSTAGATTTTFTPPAGATYYLVGPTNGVEEGSYGTDSNGLERPQGAGACLPRSIVSCE
jgi:hypothetical protein